MKYKITMRVHVPSLVLSIGIRVKLLMPKAEETDFNLCLGSSGASYIAPRYCCSIIVSWSSICVVVVVMILILSLETTFSVSLNLINKAFSAMHKADSVTTPLH